MQKNGVEEKAVEVDLGGVAYPRLRLRVRGGIAQVGQPTPGIEIATRERAIVFLASGAAPFTATWGDVAGEPRALPLATLVPKYQANKPFAAGTANLEVRVAPPLVVPAPVAQAVAQPAPQPAREAQKPAKPAREHDAWLWAALLGAVAGLGAMAWSLLRQKPEVL
ncbi:DUF3999 family protein [Ramlibacter sp. PS4R-6]|uniref:DUF3999 family protein n=1 Tax=Ramlibacter sp. PS4R-6 TaxID=3133438 RepID=UPI0030AE4FEF